ncbi:MAG: histidine phosphatase family protein [Anaerolineae bacterium]|nr:histidine phosphatase family protein [Anaerolineae bacterium]
MTTIHFVRHGEVHNPQDILYARLPRFRLSDRGRAQVQSTAGYLKDRPIAAIYSSPMLRARQTAAVIAAPHSLKVSINRLLNEIHSPYQGKPHDFLESIDWNLYENLEKGYERAEDIMNRVQTFTARMRKKHAGQEIVAVTHGDVVLFVQMWARKLPLTHVARRSIQPYPATASINSLIYHDGSPQPDFEFRVPYEKVHEIFTTTS